MASFDESGRDTRSFPPFLLVDMREETGDIILALPEGAFPDLSIVEYPATGHGLRALFIAARVDAGLKGEPESVIFEAEFDQCFAMFSSPEDADNTAALISAAFQEPAKLEQLARLALANDLY